MMRVYVAVGEGFQVLVLLPGAWHQFRSSVSPWEVSEPLFTSSQLCWWLGIETLRVASALPTGAWWLSRQPFQALLKLRTAVTSSCQTFGALKSPYELLKDMRVDKPHCMHFSLLGLGCTYVALLQVVVLGECAC